MEQSRTVRPDTNGGWAVYAPGSRRASSHQPTRYDAIAFARRNVARGGGTVEIQDTDGQTLEVIVVPTRTNRRANTLHVR
jgi:hypothetical protein